MAEMQVAQKAWLETCRIFAIATLVFCATGRHCIANDDLVYDGSAICGYGKIDYAAFAMDDAGLSTFVVKMNIMSNVGHYLSFHGDSVIRIRAPAGSSAALNRAEYVSRVYTILASVGQDRAVRILSNQSTGKKCDTTADFYDVKLCSPAYSCWDDGPASTTTATDGS